MRRNDAVSKRNVKRVKHVIRVAQLEILKLDFNVKKSIVCNSVEIISTVREVFVFQELFVFLWEVIHPTVISSYTRMFCEQWKWLKSLDRPCHSVKLSEKPDRR